ncbi:MAG TPA: hypothetical protein VHN11_22705, partial [Xanthobacteraceae bacterium]|nr:hypothetical protein [Xanthobacteraceae bacterium]
MLPEPLGAQLGDLGKSLAKGRVSIDNLRAIVAQFNDLEPALAISAENEIAGRAELYRRSRPHRWWDILRLFASTDTELLLRTPELKELFIFHRDGRLREAALNLFHDGLSSSFFVTALVLRGNDWVQEVRIAAAACARRVLPKTAPDIVAAALLVLLDRMWQWRRWGDEAVIIDAALSRPDVASRLAEKLRLARTGPTARLLRRALHQPTLDAHLLALSQTAFAPAVRAVALQAMIEGHASWRVGVEYRWIDKSMGKRVIVPKFETRSIHPLYPRELAILQGAQDRSAAVRKIAAAGAVKYRTTLANLDEI